MAPESKDSDFAELEDKKIKAVASPKEKREFDTDSALDRVRYKLEKQKLHLRWFACFVAIATVFVFGYLEYGILQNIEFLSTIPGDLIFLVASPILAVTAIVVSFLISVFRVNVDNAGKATQIIGGTSNGLG